MLKPLDRAHTMAQLANPPPASTRILMGASSCNREAGEIHRNFSFVHWFTIQIAIAAKAGPIQSQEPPK